MRNCNPLNDYLFKYVFGHIERKHITISFLNAVLELDGDKEIKDIEFVDRELDAKKSNLKSCRLDILCKTNNGERINIEVQIADRDDMKKRSLFYWATLYSGQLQKGEAYKTLCKTIAINIVDFEMFPHFDVHSIYQAVDVKHDIKMTDFEIHFLEVPKFKSKSVKEMRRLDRWIAYLKNDLNVDETDELLNTDLIIKQAVEAESVFMQNDAERAEYDAREKQLRDKLAFENYAHRKGVEEGLGKGMKIGIEKGKIEIAKNLFELGIPVETIMKSTGLSKEQIESL